MNYVRPVATWTNDRIAIHASMKNPVVPLRAAVALLVAVAAFAAAAAPARADDPDDPAWPAEWGQRLVHVQDVWAGSTGDPSIVIATVDTGAVELPDLEGAFVPGWDFVDGDGDTTDRHGHGTQIASVIAARGDNGEGMAGYCWRCRLMPVRVSSDGTASEQLIAEGIRFAVDHGARIVNVSLNAPGPPDWAEEAAVAYAVSRGVLVVASAGNTGSTELRYPAAFPGVLAVGGSDESDRLYPWSTHGAWVELTAPGCDMVLDRTVEAGTICGTSFTPAVVSGIAGLLFSLRPSLTAAQVAEALERTAVPVDGVAAGRVDAAAAMRWLGLEPAPTAPAPAPATQPGGEAAPSGEPREQATAFARGVELRTGTVRREARFAFRIGQGSLNVELYVRPGRGCSLTLLLPDRALVGLPGEVGLLQLTTSVDAGRYTILLDCPTRRPKPYVLALSGLLAPEPSASNRPR